MVLKPKLKSIAWQLEGLSFKGAKHLRVPEAAEAGSTTLIRPHPRMLQQEFSPHTSGVLHPLNWLAVQGAPSWPATPPVSLFQSLLRSPQHRGAPTCCFRWQIVSHWGHFCHCHPQNFRKSRITSQKHQCKFLRELSNTNICCYLTWEQPFAPRQDLWPRYCKQPRAPACQVQRGVCPEAGAPKPVPAPELGPHCDDVGSELITQLPKRFYSLKIQVGF